MNRRGGYNSGYGPQGGTGGVQVRITPYDYEDPDPAKTALSGKVKEIQRASPLDVQKWWLFCDTRNKQNVYDPVGHDATFLAQFVELWNKGASEEEYSTTKPGCHEFDPRCIRLRGIPFGMTESDVAIWLAEYGGSETRIALGRNNDGSPSGDAYCLMPTETQAKTCIREKHMTPASHRQVKVFESHYSEWFFQAQRAEAMPIIYKEKENSGKPAYSSGDPKRDELVHKVKQIQRNNEKNKQKWWSWCDKRMQGQYDPGKQSIEFLGEFIDAFTNGFL